MIEQDSQRHFLSFDVIKNQVILKYLQLNINAVISVCCDCSCSNITIIPVTLEEIVDSIIKAIYNNYF